MMPSVGERSVRFVSARGRGDALSHRRAGTSRGLVYTLALEDCRQHGHSVVVVRRGQGGSRRQAERKEPLLTAGRPRRLRSACFGDLVGGCIGGDLALRDGLGRARLVQFRAQQRRIHHQQRLAGANPLAGADQDAANTAADLSAQRARVRRQQAAWRRDCRRHLATLHPLGPDTRQRSTGPGHLAPGRRRRKRDGGQRDRGLSGGAHRGYPIRSWVSCERNRR